MKHIITYTLQVQRFKYVSVTYINLLYHIKIITAELCYSEFLYMGLVELTCHKHIVITEKSLLFIYNDKYTHTHTHIYRAFQNVIRDYKNLL